MTRIASRGPLGQKAEKAKPDPAYLAKVRALPCVICAEFGEPQLSQTTAHHVIMGRYSTHRTPDRMAIPLCDGHHQGTFDTSKTAIHRSPTAWEAKYGPDYDWSAKIQDMLKE